jgi:hypothetical protein
VRFAEHAVGRQAGRVDLEDVLAGGGREPVMTPVHRILRALD